MSDQISTFSGDQTKTLCLIIDAASFPMVERLLKESKLPHLARIAGEGSWGPLEVNEFNCQTPAALASILTGRPSENNGIGGFFTPARAPGLSATALRSSFLDCRLDDPLIWEWACQNGKTVTLAHVPFSQNKGFVHPNVRFSVCGYDRRVSRGELVGLSNVAWRPDGWDVFRQAEIRLGDYGIQVEAWRRHADAPAISRLRLTAMDSGHSVEFAPGGDGPLARRDLKIDKHTATAVYVLVHPAAGEIYLYFAGVYHVFSANPSQTDSFLNSTGAFQGEACGRYYRAGRFGAPYYRGGDGSAERMFSRLLAGVTDYFRGVYGFCLREFPADFTVYYLPTIDEASHEWAGFVDSRCDLFDPSGPYHELLATVYQDCDRVVGEILEQSPPNTSIIILSDHGMAGCSRVLYMNTLLEKEGFLSFTPTGEIDLTETAVFFHPAENGAICVNSQQSDTLKKKIKRMLEEYLDPHTGAPIAYKVVDMSLQNMAHNFVYGDLFFVPHKSLSVKASASPTGDISEKTYKSGIHHFNRDERLMKGVYFISGQSQDSGGLSHPLSNLDIFPVICRLLGIPLPPGLVESPQVRRLFSKS